MAYKTTEAQRKASKEYRKRNKEQEKIQSYRRTAKMYIHSHATLEDLIMLHQLSLNRMEELLDNPFFTEQEKEDYRKELKKELDD